MIYAADLTLLAALFHSSVSGAIVKRSADDSPQQQCSYSFNVLANTGETCPPSAPSDVTLAEIQASLADLNNIFCVFGELLLSLIFILDFILTSRTKKKYSRRM